MPSNGKGSFGPPATRSGGHRAIVVSSRSAQRARRWATRFSGRRSIACFATAPATPASTFETRASATSVSHDDGSAVVAFDEGGRRGTAAGRFVLDCSGRAGVLARRFRQPEPGYRTCALVGVWSAAAAGISRTRLTPLSKPTTKDGCGRCRFHRRSGMLARWWTARRRRRPGAARLERVYRAEIAKACNLGRVLDGATLQRVWACDASLYSSTQYGGSQFLLIGDAGSFIDPLSSFGVKKALASAWLGAIAVHTSLAHPDRREVALEFFSQWERDVYADNLDRSRAFARAARERHPHAFWASRAAAGAEADGRRDGGEARHPDLQAVFERFKQTLVDAADARRRRPLRGPTGDSRSRDRARERVRRMP